MIGINYPFTRKLTSNKSKQYTVDNEQCKCSCKPRQCHPSPFAKEDDGDYVL